MDYEQKYLKYKKKYIELKNQYAGGDWRKVSVDLIVLSHPDSGVFRDIGRINERKIVATPISTPQYKGITGFIKSWLELSKPETDRILQVTSKRLGYEFGIFIYRYSDNRVPDLESGSMGSGFIGNRIIFYSVKHLQILAEIVGKTVDELLNMFAIPQHNPYNKDLIKIAFGDNLEDEPLETDEGHIILAKYLSMI